MRNKIASLVIGTALIGTIAFNTEASAAEINVKQGDTLWNIAQNNGTTVEQLKKVNNLTSDIILPSQTLETSNKSANAEKVESTHTVKSGETLSGISLDYGVKVNELKDWNDLNSDIIVVNQELLVKAEAKETTKSEPTKETNEKSEKQTENKSEKQTENKSEKKTENKSEKKRSKERRVEKERRTVENKSEEKSEKTSNSGQSMTMEATAYTAQCDGCTGITATGIDLNANSNKKVVAVDPSVIPLGSRVHVEGYGEAIAGDTGGAIKGDRIDVHLPTKDAALGFGRQSVNVTVLD